MAVNKIVAYEGHCEPAHVNGSADDLVSCKCWLGFFVSCFGYDW